MQKKINVYIVGAGEIGTALAAQMVRDGCAVTVIDTDSSVIGAVNNSLDVYCFEGNGASYATLQEAGAGGADILIAVTDSDELNILSCLTAHMMGAKHTIARVRDVDYAKHSSFYRSRLGLSMTINPELAAAREVSRVLRFPSATRVEVFAKGRAELVEMPLSESSPMCGKSLMEIGQRRDFNLLICAVARQGRVIIPKGHFVLEAGDTLYLTGAAASFRTAFKAMDMPVKPVHTALLSGAGRISHYLAELLLREGVRVTVVERRHTSAVEFCRAVPDCSVMNDDVIGYLDGMSEADLHNTDAFVALTENDELNMVASMYAASMGVGKVLTRLGGGSRLRGLQKSDRVSVVSQENAAVDLILSYSRSLMDADENDAVESVCRLMDGRIEFIEFRVAEHTAHTGRALRTLRMKPDTLIACIMRGVKTIVPRGDDEIRPGDSVLIATANSQVVRLEDAFEEAVELP